MSQYLILAAVLPALLLIGYVYKKDSIEKEPAELLLKLFVFGALCCIPAIIMETIGDMIVGIFAEEESSLFNLISYFCVVAFSEELCKFLVLKRVAWNHPAFDYRFDAIVYTICIGMGFAALENVMYVFEGGFGLAALRAVTAVPAHGIFAVFMGYYIGEAKMAEGHGSPRKSAGLRKLGFIVPVLLHGFYDFCASEEHMLIFLVFIILMDIHAFRRVKKSSLTDARVIETPIVDRFGWGDF